MESSLIGKGSMGIVLKPALKCKNYENVNYKGKVSKIFADQIEAENEFIKVKHLLDEHKEIQKYMLGLPTLCKPKLNDHYYDALKNERKVRDSDNMLLILEDGGKDLSVVSDKLSSYSSTELALFLTSILNIIEGVAFFRKKDIIHQDIKMENIVYKKSNSQMKFIDFGLATSRSEFIHAAKNNFDETRDDEIYYYPKENVCLKKKRFEHVKRCTIYQSRYKYDDFLSAVADSFDTFCLARTLYVVLCEKAPDNLDKLFVSEVEALLQEYKNPLELRKDDIMALYNLYKDLLIKYKYYAFPPKNIVTRIMSSVFGKTRKKRVAKKNQNYSTHDDIENKSPNIGGNCREKKRKSTKKQKRSN